MNSNRHHEAIFAISGGLIVFYFIYKLPLLLIISLAIIIIGLLSPFLAKYIFKAWMGLAKVLGYINSRILLTVIYFLILTPLALLRNLFRKKPHSVSLSNYSGRNHKFLPSDFDRPF